MSTKPIYIFCTIALIFSCQKEYITFDAADQNFAQSTPRVGSYHLDERTLSHLQFIDSTSIVFRKSADNPLLDFLKIGDRLFTTDEVSGHLGLIREIVAIEATNESIRLQTKSSNFEAVFEALAFELKAFREFGQDRRADCIPMDWAQLQLWAQRAGKTLPDLPEGCEFSLCVRILDYEEDVGLDISDDKILLKFIYKDIGFRIDYEFACDGIDVQINEEIPIPILELIPGLRQKIRGEQKLKENLSKIEKAVEDVPLVSDFVKEQSEKILGIWPDCELVIKIKNIFNESKALVTGTLKVSTSIELVADLKARSIIKKTVEKPKVDHSFSGDVKVDCRMGVNWEVFFRIKSVLDDKNLLVAKFGSSWGLAADYPQSNENIDSRLKAVISYLPLIEIDADLNYLVLPTNFIPGSSVLKFNFADVLQPIRIPIPIPLDLCKIEYNEFFTEMVCDNGDFKLRIFVEPRTSLASSFDFFINGEFQGSHSYVQPVLIDVADAGDESCFYKILVRDSDNKKCVLQRTISPPDGFCGLDCLNTEGCRMGEFLDDRIAGQEQIYETVTIAGKEWFTENLRYQPGGVGITNEESEFTEQLGVYYTWYEVNSPDKSICPDGWRIPTVEDYRDLVAAAGSAQVAGVKLKSQGTWFNGGGTDELCFSAVSNGYYTSWNQQFLQVGEQANFWTAERFGENSAHSVTLFRDSDRVNLNFNDEKPGAFDVKAFGHACRCVRDVN